MNKTIVANPATGLQVVPARIILESNGLTVKTGAFGGKSYPYSSIESVDFRRGISVTLAGTIIIKPFKSAPIELMGFYKSQYQEVKDAIVNGGYMDNDSSIYGSNVYSQQESPELTKAEIEARERKEERINNDLKQIQSLDVETKDLDLMISKMNYLSGVIESSDGDIKKAALSKFKTQYAFLRQTSPKHPMLSSYKKLINKRRKKIILALIIILICMFLLLVI